MSRPGRRRSEDELRAAFAAKATQAPKAEDVLRAVRQATRTRPSRLRWLLPAVATAAAVAVAVPFALSVSDSNSGSTKTLGKAAGAGDARTQYQAPAAPSAMSASNGVCRPDQVHATVTLHRDAGVERATLTVTALADCSLARVPRVTWNGAAVPAPQPAPAQGGGQGGGGASSKQAASQYGQLAAGATATATIQAADPCSASAGDAVRVDWGAGEVELRATGASACAAREKQEARLNIGPFTGLS